MVRRIAIVTFSFWAAGFVFGQNAVNEVQHSKLPKLGTRIDFIMVTLKNGLRDLPPGGSFNPGSWSDVRLVEWNPPWATISGYRKNSVSLRTARVHMLSFPDAIKAQVQNQDREARSVMTNPAYHDALLLSDGRILQQVSVLRAVPGEIVLRHSQGEETLAPSQLPPSFFRAHPPAHNFLYLHELSLTDGTKLEGVKIAPTDKDHCRIAHRAGVQTTPLSELPEDVQHLVVTHLITPGKFSTEIVTDPALRKQRAPTVAQRSPTPASTPTPAPTPRPALLRQTFAHYLTLPLANGQVLSDVKCLSVDDQSAHFVGPKGEQGVPLAQLPEEVRGELGSALIPAFRELLEHGVVARHRSPLFELASPAPESPDLKEAAKGASGGRTIGYVGAGFLATEGRWRNPDGAAAQFPKALTGIQRAFVLGEDFAHLGEKSWRKWWLNGRHDPLPELVPPNRRYLLKFAPAVLDAESILLDPFEGRHTLFGNRKGIIRRAWKITPTSRENLTIVETDSGFYLGLLTRQPNLAESQMSWTQLAAHQDSFHTLQKISQKTLQKNTILFQLPTDQRLSPESSRIRPIHYRTLTENGLPGLQVALNVPQTDGFEKSSDSTANYDREKEIEIDRVNLQIATETAGTIVFSITCQQRERLVERTRDRDGRTLVHKDPWKIKRTDTPWEADRDADGGIRFTDGTRIYEILPQKIGGTQLITYEIRENALRKPKP